MKLCALRVNDSLNDINQLFHQIDDINHPRNHQMRGGYNIKDLSGKFSSAVEEINFFAT